MALVEITAVYLLLVSLATGGKLALLASKSDIGGMAPAQDPKQLSVEDDL